MSFINKVMSDEMTRKGLVLFEETSGFKDVDFPSDVAFQTSSEGEIFINKPNSNIAVWLTFVLVISTFFLILQYINNMPVNDFPEGLQAAELQKSESFERGQIKAYTANGEGAKISTGQSSDQAIEQVVSEQQKLLPETTKNLIQDSSVTVTKPEVAKNPKAEVKSVAVVETEISDPTVKSAVVNKQAVAVKTDIVKPIKKRSGEVLDFTSKKVVFEKVLVNQNETHPDDNSEAISLLGEGDLVSATSKLEQSLSNNPANTETRELLATTLIKQNRIEQAVRVYQQGLKIDPYNLVMAESYAHLMVEQGNIDQALLILKKAAPEVQQNLKYYSFIAALEQQKGNHKNAISVYKNILSFNSNNGKWWLGLGISLMSETKNKEALFAFEKSLNDDRVTPALKQFASQRISFLENRGS